MTSPERGIESQLRNIEQTYGRSIDELVGVVERSRLKKHPEVVAMLKERFGMAHGAAHRVSLVARERLNAQAATPAAPRDSEMAALYGHLLSVARTLGGDVAEAPKKGYVSLRRRKQFAMLQAAARCVNVGLILPGVEPRGRLEPAGNWNALFTHRVRVATPSEVDDELIGWMRDAYLRAA